MKKGFTKTRHSDEQSEEESNKLDRSFAVTQDDRLREGFTYTTKSSPMPVRQSPWAKAGRGELEGGYPSSNKPSPNPSLPPSPRLRRTGREGSYRSGFTLVELSIVLVIIGLLISGLLVGQSMIKAAKVQAQVKQLQQFDVLIRNFKEVYRYLPGDLPNATAYFGVVSGSCNTVAGTGTQSCNGDGDGTIDYVNTDNTIHEAWRAWEHLSHAGFLDIEYTGVYGTSCTYGSGCIVPGTNIPEAEIGESTGIHIFEIPTTSGSWATYVDRHVYALGSSSNTVNPAFEGVWYGRGLTPAEALAIDVKIDDGDALVGKTVAMNTATYMGPNCTNADYTAPASYNPAYSDPTCTLLISTEFYE